MGLNCIREGTAGRGLVTKPGGKFAVTDKRGLQMENPAPKVGRPPQDNKEEHDGEEKARQTRLL